MYLITYFNYLTAVQTNTQNNLAFSHALPAAHALHLNTQNCAWFGSQISVICCELSGGFAPETPTGVLPLDLAGGLPSPRPSVPPTSKSWLRHYWVPRINYSEVE